MHVLHKGVARQFRLFRHSLYLDMGGDHRDTVLVAGAARSGTTWLSNILNHDNAFRSIFEPFNKTFVPEARSLRRRQYARADAEQQPFADGVARMMSGDVRNAWVDRHNRRLISERRMVKEVSANLLLGWMRRRFPGMPIVFVIRHPCAVARSRTRLWTHDMTREWVEQFDLVADHLLPFMELIGSKLPPFERHVLDWCVEHYVPLRMLDQRDVCVVFYEELCVDAHAALRRVGRYLGRTYDVPESVLATPSQQARRSADGSASAILTGASLLDDWRRYVSAAELGNALEIVRLFGLDRIYSGSSMPRKDQIFEETRATVPA